MRPALFFMTWLLLWVTGAMPTQAGPVDAARAKQEADCMDGVGTTYLAKELQAALDADVVSGFYAKHAACSPDDIDTYTLIARCSPSVPLEEPDDEAIICMAAVQNPSEIETLMLADAQFSLASNTMRYRLDSELTALLRSDLTTGNEATRVYPSTVGAVYMVFRIPDEQASDDFVLIWHVPESAPNSSSSWRRLQVLLADRDNELAFELSGQAGPSTPVAGELFRFTGRSDAVSDPISLPAGIYVAQASYRGDSNIAVWVHGSDGTSDLLVNEIGTYAGQATFRLENATEVIFEVTGIGSWEIVIMPAFS